MVEKYSKSMRVLHWLSAILILALITSGAVMVDQEAGDFKWQLYANHKSLGITIFVLFFIRAIVRIFSIVPKFPKELSSFWSVSAKAGHFLLYLLMLVVPLCGIAMNLFGGYPLSYFGAPLKFLTMAKDAGYAQIFNELHGNFAWALAAIVGLHVLGAIKHLIIDKLNLFKRII
jgi:cytochrome b561